MGWSRQTIWELQLISANEHSLMKVGRTERKRTEEMNTGNVPGSIHADINISKRSGVVNMFDVNQYFLRSSENSKLLNRELYFREIKCPFKAKEQLNF